MFEEPSQITFTASKIWHWKTSRLWEYSTGHIGEITSITWANSDSIVVAVSEKSGVVCSWDFKKGTLLRTIQTDEPLSVAGSLRHSLVLTNDSQKTFIFDAGKPSDGLRTIKERLPAAAYMPDGKSFIAFSGRAPEHGPQTWGRRQVTPAMSVGSHFDGAAPTSDDLGSLINSSTYLLGPQVCESLLSFVIILNIPPPPA